MARIVHRHRLPSLAPARGLRRLPVPGRVFLVLAAVVAAVELWPAIDAIWLGVTDIVDELSTVLPTTFRNAAIVALPAAVLWARSRAPRVNPWLWKGAVLVAAVQLSRYPIGLVQETLVEAASTSEAGAASPEYAIASILALLLAFATALGIWALSEGLKDAGARFPNLVIVGLAVAVAAVMTFVFGPSVRAAIEAGNDPQLPINLVSVLANGLYLLSLAVLGARGVAGVARALDGRMAWRLGAIAAVSLAVLPVVSVFTSYLVSTSGETAPEIVYTVLRLAVFIGWPLFAVALGMGMAAWPARRPGDRRLQRHSLGSAARYLAPGAAPR